MKSPVVGPVDRIKSPVISEYQKKPITWAFSFKYFNQIKYFGLDTVSTKWFASLLERLKDLSSQKIDIFFRDIAIKQQYRYHPIGWGLKNVPIKRMELNWIDKEYLENEEEFPFYQFQLSQANGRIVGFWNEESNLFYIVLLDPEHNMQPSKNYNYKVDDCHPLSCKYSSLLKKMDDVKRMPCSVEGCGSYQTVVSLLEKESQTNAILGHLDDSFLIEYEKILKKKSLSEILEAGIYSLLGEGD